MVRALNDSNRLGLSNIAVMGGNNFASRGGYSPGNVHDVDPGISPQLVRKKDERTHDPIKQQQNSLLCVGA